MRRSILDRAAADRCRNETFPKSVAEKYRKKKRRNIAKWLKRDHLCLLLSLLLLLGGVALALGLDVLVVDGHGLVDLGTQSRVILDPAKIC